MKIPFSDLNAQYKQIKKDVNLSLGKIFSKGDFILGGALKEFEIKFAKYCNTKYAVGVNSGTDALFLSLKSLGIGRGDEVVVPAFTFIATAFAVSFTGAKPVFVDIDEESYSIDVSKIEKAITKKTKAIIPVHLYGQPADMAKIKKIAKKYKLKVIEDSAQAHGSKYKDRRVGSIGDVGCFSFYPAKNLGAFGDGGIITTNSEKIYKKLLGLRDYGRTGKYVHAEIGFNSRLDTVQAAVLIEKLKYLDSWNRSRMEKAKIYDRLLNEVKGVVIPKRVNFGTHVYHVYAIRLKNRNIVQKRLCENGVSAIIHYPIPLHLQKAYKHLGYKRGDFPVAEKVAREIVSLPLFPHMKNNQINFVVDKLKELLSGK